MNYAQKDKKSSLIIKVTTHLPASGRVRHPMETFLRASGRPFCPSASKEGQNGNPPRIIPVNTSPLQRSLAGIKQDKKEPQEVLP